MKNEQNDKEPESKFNPNATYQEATYSEAWKEHRPPEYQAYRELWEQVPKAKQVLDFPIHLDIETTNLCNLKCPMCPRTILVSRGELGDEGCMSREEYASIIDQGMEHGLQSIKLNYLGEPLVHKDVIWQVEYAKQKGVLDVMMNSNASALTDKVARGLLKAGIDNLFVSFDAISPKLFEQQRAGTTLGRVVDNIYNFIKLRDADYPHVQVRLSMVMYENDPLWAEQFEGLKIMWKDLVDAVGYGFYTERDPDERGEYPEVQGFWCAQPYQRMFLKYNGQVTVCCIDDKDEMVVGNWHQQSLHEIWHGERYAKIRRQHAQGNYYQLELCRKCYLPMQS